ncbi:trichohyalin [Drosophila takahashii]|uniref:trichohyalin n=1 Tax=Drosophila takahashii TaxID=29030 RepID=UPI001CF82D9B|nr:trichohyalin [Drosophila takahashii]
MASVKKRDVGNRIKRSSLEDRLERNYRQKVRIIRGLTARNASAKDLDLCAKWMYVFSRATKEEGRARDYLLEQMLRQLRESGQLSLPFTNLANCSLELRLLLDEEGRQRLRRFSPPQVVAPRPSSCILATRRIKPSSFEWRRRVQHLDHLEDQYWREEQEIWNLDLPTEECPEPKPTPIAPKAKKTGKTFGLQVDVPVLSPRAERDLCERERKQRQILKRRERDRLERQVREQERDRQRILLAEQRKLDSQRLEKARQQRDRRLREQQLKVKERRDYERYLLLKKREAQRLQDQRLWTQRRPCTPSSEDFKVRELEQHPNQELRHEVKSRSEAIAITMPVESDATKSSRREQQLHLRAENIKRKVLAYEQLKEYHREKARSEREKQLRKRRERDSKEPLGANEEVESNNQIEKGEKNKNLQKKARKPGGEFEQKDFEKKVSTDQGEDIVGIREQEQKRLRKHQEKIKETDRMQRKDFERMRQQEVTSLSESIEKVEPELTTVKERKKKEDIAKKELKSETDQREREEHERKREQELQALLNERREREEFERKVLERLETERKEREDLERRRQHELISLKERQEREEFERKELEKRLETDRKEKEDLERKRELDLKCQKELREREEFEKKVFEKLDKERKEREVFERKTCEEREREGRTIEELKATLNEVQKREIKRNEELEKIAQEKRELEKREQDECERISKEEELVRERRLLEKIKQSKSEREELERNAREEDLKREKILRRWLQMQEEEEMMEKKERDIRQKRILEKCERKIIDRTSELTDREEKERKDREEHIRQKKDILLQDQQKKSKLEDNRLKRKEEEHLRDKLDREERDWNQRIELLRQTTEGGIQLESKAIEVSRKLKKHFERRLELYQNDDMRENKSNNILFENPPGDIQKLGSTSKDVHISLNRLNEKHSSRLSGELELRLEAGVLSDRNFIQRNNMRRMAAEPKSKDVDDEYCSHQQLGTQKTRSSSSREYFYPGSLKCRRERWARFMGSEDNSESGNYARQGRESLIGRSSSAENNPEPRYSLVGRYSPQRKSYTVNHQNVPPTPYGNTEQQEAYGSYVRNRVAEWRKMLRPRSSSTDEKELEEKREEGGGIAGDIGLTYCTRTGKKRYTQIKQPEISRDQIMMKEDRGQQRRVFGQLLSQARTSDYHPDILAAENCLLQKKLSEGQAKATNNYIQEAMLLVARRLISVFQSDETYVSSEEENETYDDKVPAQIYLQEIKTKAKLPRPVFKTLMKIFPSSDELIMPHFVEKIGILDIELEVHLKKICNRVFGRQGDKILRRNAEQLMHQQRFVQSCHLTEMCRDSEEQTLRQWRRLERNLLVGIRNLFYDYCDMRDALPSVTLQTIERLYSEWKARRFTIV